MKPILDISEFQQRITYSVAAKHIEGVIVRIGGTGYTSHKVYQDALFESHYNGFHKLGVPVGVYFYAGALNEKGVQEEVDLVARLLKNKVLELPVFYDVEVEAWQGEHGKLSKTVRTKLALSFCKKIEALGYKAGLYTGVSFKDRIDLKKFPCLWMAQYNSVLQYSGHVDLWQYTSSGVIPGIGGRVDLSKVMAQEEKPVEEKPVEEIPSNVYVVKSGDTLSGIAQKFNTSVSVLTKLNNIVNPNLIFPGDKIKLPTSEKPVEDKPQVSPKDQTYTVKSGDTLWGIAQKFGTTVKKIIEDNDIENPNLIYPGTILKI